MAGWFVKRFEEYGGISGFAWTSDRRALQGGNVRNGPQLQHVVFEDQARMQIDQLNEPRAADALALYTWHFAPDTGTKADGAEVVVRMKEPLSLFSNAKGEIVKVRQNAGASPLPFNHIVLSAHGKAAAELLRHARAGQPVSFQLELKDHGSASIGLAPQDWRGAYASIGGPEAHPHQRHRPARLGGQGQEDTPSRARSTAPSSKTRAPPLPSTTATFTSSS